jgi:hypothetical protein
MNSTATRITFLLPTLDLGRACNVIAEGDPETPATYFSLTNGSGFATLSIATATWSIQRKFRIGALG